MKLIPTSLVLLLVFASSAVAEPNDPVRLSDINAMLKQGKDAEQVLLAMNERGVGFRLTASAERRLKGWDFTEAEIESIRGIMAGNKYAPQDEPGLEDADDPGDFPIGHGPDDHELMRKVLSRAVDAAKLNYSTHNFARATLYCSARKSKQALPLLAAVEKKLVAEFPPCLANATHPDATLFIVTDNQQDFMKFCKVLALSYDKQWPGFAEDADFEDITFWVLANAIVINGAEIQSNDQLGRHLAFGMGFMVVDQISDEESPEGLSTGFGNVLERHVAGTPSITLTPESGEADDEINNWERYVRDQLATRKLDEIGKVCRYTVSHMHHRHYAISWSLAEDLVKDPLVFYSFLKKTDEKKDVPREQLLAEVYSTDIEAMHQRWMKTIGPK